jgi:hypothetical protein
MMQIIYNFFNEILFSLILPGIGLGLFAVLGSKFIPNLLPQYKLPAEIFGLVLVVFFVFQAGREHEYDKAKVKIEEDKALIKHLAEETAKLNLQLKSKFAVKTKIVKEIKNVPTIIYVPKEADTKCVIEPNVADGVAGLLNSAIEGKLPPGATRVDGEAK